MNVNALLSSPSKRNNRRSGRNKLCFLLLGFTFGVLVTRCIQWFFAYDSGTAETSQYQVFHARAPVSHIHVHTLIPQTNITQPLFGNGLLNGLQAGMSLVAKNPVSSSKRVRLLYIVGNEGSGHHLWENLMKEMSKHSSLINTNYIDNGVLLVECLHACFMEIYHEKKGKIETKEERQYFNAAQTQTKKGFFVEYSCDALRTELEKVITNDVSDGSLVYLRSFSYPFMGLQLYKMPNIVTLINIAQQIVEIDVKVIVMKREWVNSMVSSCVHRYGECIERIQMQHAVLSIIQSQLLSIDPAFWIMIDYEDFVSRALGYVDIISDWLLIEDKELIRNAIKHTVKASSTSTTQSGWDELNKNAKSSVSLVKNIFYSDYSKNMWPVYNSPYFCVTPENRVFLDSKYKK